VVVCLLDVVAFPVEDVFGRRLGQAAFPVEIVIGFILDRPVFLGEDALLRPCHGDGALSLFLFLQFPAPFDSQNVADFIPLKIQQISANVSCSGIYFYIYCANYCSVFVPARAVLVQKLNNNSHNKCNSKSPKTTRLQKSAVK
jgi:hypothetical protein